MHSSPVIVVQYKPLEFLPPVMNQLLALRAAGRTVHFVGVESEAGDEFLRTNGISRTYLPYDVNLYRNDSLVTKVTHRLARAKRFLPCRAALNSAVEKIAHEYGMPILWFMDTQSAALMGNRVQMYFPHVLVSIFELAEAGGRHWLGFDFATFLNKATVVVPEFNRAHILKEHYRLKRLPCVVANTCFNHPRCTTGPLPLEARKVFDRIGNRPVFLYQGVWTEDRRDVGFLLETIARNRPQYCVVMMPENEAVRKLLSPYANAFAIPYTPPPHHLSVTARASVGVAVYTASGRTDLERLNAVYCAPNKIYEYAGFGIPTLGNDIPGLKYTIEAAGAGICTPMEEQRILEAADRLILNLDEYRARAARFYSSVDLQNQVTQTLIAAEGNGRSLT